MISTFSRFFVQKLFCTVSYSYVLCSIRFAIRFQIGLFMSRRCAKLCKNAITWFIGFTGVKICVGSLKIKQTYIKKYLKITGWLKIAMRKIFMRKHPLILVLPTQLQFLSKFLGMDSQGISSKFVYHEIQHHPLNQITYLKYEKYPQEKI